MASTWASSRPDDRRGLGRLAALRRHLAGPMAGPAATVTRGRPAAAAAAAAAAADPAAPHGGAYRPTATGVNGMVACAHPLAAQAGMRVLQQGGNAIDAGVAVAAALSVVEPFMSGLGGGGWMQVHHAASGDHKALDYCGVIPAAAEPHLFTPQSKSTGIHAPVVPGSPAGWLEMLRRYGSGLGAAAVFAPAIELAAGGFPLTKRGEQFFATSFAPGGRLSSGNFEHGEVRRVFMRNAEAAEEFTFGDVVKNPELAQTFERLVQHGADEFYRAGVTRDALLRCMDQAGGFITAEDLSAYAPRWRDPVGVEYRGHWVSSCPAPCHGIQTLMTLGLLEGCKLNGQNSAHTLHLVIESVKLAAAERAMWNQHGEGAPTAEMLSPQYLASRRGLIGATARDSPTHAAMFDVGTPAEAGDPMAWFKSQGSTTHFDVVDKAGNALGCTHSLGGGFGSGVVVPGTGVALNNFLNWADLDPASPACIRGGMPASRTDISCVSPMMVWRAGSLRYCCGTPGSYGIPQTTTQLLVNLLDFGMDMQAAIEAPRFRMCELMAGASTVTGLAEGQSVGKALQIESRVSAAVRDELTARGHDLLLQPEWTATVGGVQGIELHASGALSGGADPRRDGYAIGW